MLRRHISPSSSSSSLPHTWFKSSSLPSNRRGTISPLRISPSPCPTPHALLKHRCSQKLLHSVPSTPGPEADTPIESFNASRLLGVPAREYLKKWQDEFGKPNIEQLADYERHPLHNWLPDDLRGRFSHSPIEQNNDGDDYEDAHSGDPELDTTALFLKPGDIAELVLPNREPVLAAFLQDVDLKDQFLLPNGKWIHMNSVMIHFALPNAIDPKLISPLLPYLPTKSVATGLSDLHVPRELVKSVTTILHELGRETEKIYRENAVILDNAHAVLASDTRLRIVSLTSVAKTLLGNGDESWIPSPATILAVRKALHHNRFRFHSRLESGRMGLIFIRSKDEVDMVECAQSWIREYADYMASSNSTAGVGHTSDLKPSRGARNVLNFIKKCRRIITTSRKIRGFQAGGQLPIAPAAPLGKDCVQHGDELFDEEDQLLISFIWAWTLSDQFKSMDSLVAQCYTLLTALGSYEELGVSMSTGMLFLQEIGVVQPWENKALHNEQLMLPISRSSRNITSLRKKAKSLSEMPAFVDTMESLRHDWDDLTVYCIDDAGAKEIDDGVSIQQVPGKNDQYWVHVHVANPTAFFDKASTISKLAAHLTESVYFPEISFPMIPKWATQEYFSLGPNRPVLTFSMRLDTSGSIIETKIQNGVIRNVVSLTPKDLTRAVGAHRNTLTTRFFVGKIAEQSGTPPPELSTAQIEDLKTLYSLVFARRIKREEAGAVGIQGSSQEVRVYEDGLQTTSGLTFRTPSLLRPRFIHGDPCIELIVAPRISNFASGIDNFNPVSELMILACTAAARWCSERNIPVIFRGTVPVPHGQFNLTLAKFKTEVLDRYVSTHGPFPLALSRGFTQLLGRSITHTQPFKHQILATESYTKVTSPLRRFGDMIAHWQIEAVLRREAETGKKFGTNDRDHSLLPFSERQLQEYIATMIYRESVIAKLKEAGQRFWIVQLLFRGFYSGETKLPATWRVAITSESSTRIDTFDSIILDLDLKAFVLANGNEVQAGDEWEAKITEVRPYSREVIMEPVRILRRSTCKVVGNVLHLDTVDFENRDLSRSFETVV